MTLVIVAVLCNLIAKHCEVYDLEGPNMPTFTSQQECADHLPVFAKRPDVLALAKQLQPGDQLGFTCMPKEESF